MHSTHDYQAEAILQSLPAEIAVLDRDGTILRVNDAWKQFARENDAPDLAESSVGRNYLAICDQAIQEQTEHALEAREGLDSVLAGLLPLFSVEYPCHSPNQQRWFILYATPLQGEPGKAVVAHLDITQRKHLEQLAAANQEMSNFLSLVAHEVRTPLTSLGGYAQTAQRHLQQILRKLSSINPPISGLESPAASLREDLQHVIAQTNRLNRLIDDLAEVARIQSGTLTFQPKPHDLRQIVQETVQEQQQARPVWTLQLTLPEQAVPVQADADRIRQVLMNYLVNAFKYAPADRPITISLNAEEGQPRVEVRDQGPGLHPEEQERIWERWYRAPGPQAQKESGSSMGMGLFISRVIINMHGGQTGVISAPGAGSTFWFTLPRSVN